MILKLEQLQQETKSFYQGTPENMIFQNDSTPPNKDVNGNYDNATGIYTVRLALGGTI